MTDAPDPNQYAAGERHYSEGDRWLYSFRCPACGSCGELAVPKALHQLECPEQCGARFVQWHPPQDQQRRAALRCLNEGAARLGIEHARIKWPSRPRG
jgi:hypothetical protein